jgi:hypothetical protein
LRYCRSRVFTFVFFMQKLKGISSGQNKKSSRIVHNISNKICFSFFRFFCDFLHNLQETGKWQHYWSYPFARRTLESFAVLQCSPWRPGRGGPAKFRPTAGRGRPSTGGGGSRVARARFLGSVGARSSREGGHAGGPGRWPRRRPFPVRLQLGLLGEWEGELW